MHGKTVCKHAEQSKLENENKDSDMMNKINGADMVGREEAIKEYHKLHHGFKKASLIYIIRK